MTPEQQRIVNAKLYTRLSKAQASLAAPPCWAAMCDAPKDGTKILVWTHRQQHELARWDYDKYAKKPRPYWRTTGPWDVTDMRQIPPLAWMTLPPPPNKKGQA